MNDVTAKICITVVAVACIVAVIALGSGASVTARLVDAILVAIGGLSGIAVQGAMSNKRDICIENETSDSEPPEVI